MDTAIDDRKRMQSNQQGWNRRALAHVESSYYNLDEFRAGKSSLRSLELGVVGDVAGKDFLHLQCHIGLNAISWARRGANVTAVDFADEALKIGGELAAGLGVNVDFVHANVFDLPEVLDKANSFDIVYTDYGVLHLLPDLTAWAKVVAHFLKPGGVFHVVEIHPILSAIEEVGGGELRVLPEAIPSGPLEDEITATYGDGYEDVERIEAYKQYSWLWSIPTVVNALIQAGLRIEALTEVPVDCRQRFSNMVRDENDEALWRMPGDPLPLSYTISASKPK